MEYLFRGFHPDENGSKIITLNGKKIKGEWVEGYYGQFHNRPANPKENSHQIFVPAEHAYLCGSCIGGVWYIVIPETVGLWTGHTDASKTKIFDGDKVILNEDFDEVYTVEWDNDKACFVIEGLVISYDFDCVRNDEIEVIGNKWEEL